MLNEVAKGDGLFWQLFKIHLISYKNKYTKVAKIARPLWQPRGDIHVFKKIRITRI